MISSNDFRTGTTIEMDGSVWRVVEFLHVKPGKGSAFVRTKLKNVQSGNVVEKTFRAGESLPSANIEKRSMQHTYKDGEDYVFWICKLTKKLAFQTNGRRCQIH